jgi:predicted nicotinamide N-methyase
MASDVIPQPKFPGLVVATDFLPNVIDNLRVCVDLNFPPHIEQDGHAKAVSIGSNVASDPGGLETGMEIAKLDWTTYPKYMSDRQGGTSTKEQEEGEEMSRFATEPFDLVIASDCVYDPTHAKMLREVASWTLRLPDKAREGDIGGTFVS